MNEGVASSPEERYDEAKSITFEHIAKQRHESSKFDEDCSTDSQLELAESLSKSVHEYTKTGLTDTQSNEDIAYPVIKPKGVIIIGLSIVLRNSQPNQLEEESGIESNSDTWEVVVQGQVLVVWVLQQVNDLRCFILQ